MSILKFETRTPRSLSEMYSYMTNPAKTDDYCIFGIGLNPAYAVEEMQFIQSLYHKESLLHPYIQVIFSFDSNIGLGIEKIRQICYDIGTIILLDERQLLGAIHYKNERNIHCHYMINYVSVTGNLYRQTYSVKFYKEKINTVLKYYHLNMIYFK